MNVLVTGANGFVGSALCAAARRRGIGVRRTVREKHSSLDQEQGFSSDDVAIGEIGPSTDWRAALDGVSDIVHLAARVHVLRDRAVDPYAEYHKVNVDGTERLARAAAQAGVRRLVYMSSIKVNGEVTGLSGQDSSAYSELDSPHPADAYARSKLQAEQSLQRVAGETGLEVVILRPPLVYGPGVSANFRSLLRLVYTGVPLPLNGVRNRRSFIYIGNLVDAILRCLEAPAAGGRTYLVSDGEPVSTPELLRIIGRGLGRPARLFSVPAPILRIAAGLLGQSDKVSRLIDSLVVDDHRIQSELNWTPPFSIEEGLSATTAWYADFRRRSVQEPRMVR